MYVDILRKKHFAFKIKEFQSKDNFTEFYQRYSKVHHTVCV